MRRLIQFSNVPHEARAHDALLEPLICFTNMAVAGLMYPAWRTARVRWEPNRSELIQIFSERTRPVICFAWHKYELVGTCAFRDFPRNLFPTVICHDGFWSRALQQTGVWYDVPMWVYRRRSPVKPKYQLIDLLRAQKPVIGLFPDSGGPDGNIRTGFTDIARSAGAILIPMAWHARPVLALRFPRLYYFPVPFSYYTCFFGQPMDGTRATPEECRQVLMDFEERIQAND